MSEPFDAERIARERIAEEAERRTGFLDLGRLGLTELPAELALLGHLRRLSLGHWIELADGSLSGSPSGVPNAIGAYLYRVAPLTNLEALSLLGTDVNSLAPLIGLKNLRWLDFSGTQVSDLGALTSLTSLETLKCANTPVSDLGPLENLYGLRTLNCSGTSVSDLGPLATLVGLKSLACGYRAPVSDLSPLALLTMLRELICAGSKVTDLGPIATLAELQMLDCSDTQVWDLRPLASLHSLQALYCHKTLVSDLGPLASLAQLRTLNCHGTRVSDLGPLASLTQLQTLEISDTPVLDLGPTASLIGLRMLHCSNTQLSNLGPLSSLTGLRTLYCSNTQVSDLRPLTSLPGLQTLECSGCHLTHVPDTFWEKSSLNKVVLHNCRIPGVSADVLSQHPSDNCLGAVRAHFQDLTRGAEVVSDVKLIVLGNGRVGKTQICRRLRGEDYDSDEPSTHGILVTSAALGDGEGTTRLNIWDFGGQDLYHGTHALFLRTSAVFLLVWATETENAQVHDHGGTIFRNQPMSYWLAYVRHLAGIRSPVLIVQTRCDRQQDEALRPPLSDADVEGFGFRPVLHYSALNDRKREGLDGALREAVAWMRERQGIAQIGIGRMRVQRQLQAMRDADAAVPPEERQYRTIAQEHFHRLCDESGDVSSPAQLLRYLHNAGIVFYQIGLFRDSIVLDQGWALDAIYAVFNREKCWRELKRLRGRFTRPMLELLAWGNHSVAEQKVFLDMMRSCGICFVHREGPGRDDDATEYIAPDLLPERGAVQDELGAMWNAELPTEVAEFDFEMLHPGLVRGLICEIGGAAGVSALYWVGGVCVYETTTRSHALIEQVMRDAWRGVVRVQTRGGQASVLLGKLTAWVERRSERGGLRASRIGTAVSPRAKENGAAHGAAAPLEAHKPPGTYGQPTATRPEYFVSYAWGDDSSPEAVRRGAVVDRLCADYKARGIMIQRDTSVLQFGDSISAFVKRIGAGDRIFVVLSKKYLESPWCMAELLEIWKYSRENEDVFTRCTWVLCLPDAKIGKLEDRVEHAIWWKQRYDRIESQVKEHGISILGETGGTQLAQMMRFHLHVYDILNAIAGRVQPRTLEQLTQYGFEEIPAS